MHQWVVLKNNIKMYIKIYIKTASTNLFKHTNLPIALSATNTIHQQLTDKIVKTNTSSSGIYRLKSNTCNNSYVGQSDRSKQQDIKNTHDA
jgi:hypothetical protein